MGSAPGLIRFATRYTRSLHDAEDAYQRAMEIALTRAPVTEPRRFMAWLHTVLRNEAVAVARARHREGPGVAADVPEAYENTLEEAVSLDALAEWRERYRSIQDGLAGLTNAQRVCLMLQSAGVSYERIREITGFSLRKVERSVLEGRSNLVAWEVRLASGEACKRLGPLIDRVASAQANAKEGRVVSRHIRHCGPCRALLRDRRESNEWLAGLVPVALLSGHAFAGAPDPTPVIAWWERVSGGATVRMGSVVQMAMELPSTALAKIGAGTAAIAVAGVAGAPMVVNAVRPAAADAPVAAISRPEVTPAAAPAPSSTETASGLAAPFAQVRRAMSVAPARDTGRRERPSTRPAPPKRRAAAPAHASEVSPSATTAVAMDPIVLPPPSPPPVARTPAPSSAAVALEFGP